MYSTSSGEAFLVCDYLRPILMEVLVVGNWFHIVMVHIYIYIYTYIKKHKFSHGRFWFQQVPCMLKL